MSCKLLLCECLGYVLCIGNIEIGIELLLVIGVIDLVEFLKRLVTLGNSLIGSKSSLCSFLLFLSILLVESEHFCLLSLKSSCSFSCLVVRGNNLFFAIINASIVFC